MKKAFRPMTPDDLELDREVLIIKTHNEDDLYISSIVYIDEKEDSDFTAEDGEEYCTGDCWVFVDNAVIVYLKTEDE